MVEQLAVNQKAVGSNPTVPVLRECRLSHFILDIECGPGNRGDLKGQVITALASNYGAILSVASIAYRAKQGFCKPQYWVRVLVEAL